MHDQPLLFRVAGLLAESEGLLATDPRDTFLLSEANLVRLLAAMKDANAMAKCVERMRRGMEIKGI